MTCVTMGNLFSRSFLITAELAQAGLEREGTLERRDHSDRRGHASPPVGVTETKQRALGKSLPALRSAALSAERRPS